MSARLVWNQDRLGYYICWIIDGDEGGILGEERYTVDDLQRETDPDAREHIAANLAASNSDGVQIPRHGCYYWETQAQVKAALKMAREAIKQAHRGTPWPEWALKAQAAGWTPPKGWTP